MGLKEFIRESNRIEGIYRDPIDAEISAHEVILALDTIVLSDVEAFVHIVQPDAVLRDNARLNVRVGDHIAPRGGPAVEAALRAILRMTGCGDPYGVHHHYETLHPFTDGNGRSGRAIWLWMMADIGMGERALDLGFLHNWYYQSLAAPRHEESMIARHPNSLLKQNLSES